MSCWVNMKCDVLKDVDPDTLKKAFNAIGLDLDENRKHVSFAGYGEDDVDATIMKNGKPVTLGVKYRDASGHCIIVGDFWNTGINDATLVNTLSQQYQKINMINQIEMMGYVVDTEEIYNDGTVYLEAYCS